jgi:hypothetical protein
VYYGGVYEIKMEIPDEVKRGDGTWAHNFTSNNDLWRWAYVLVMDSVNQARALQSGSA